ncbi:MAG: hypothetical protein AAFR59_16830 [Bacteroidota bacterium]
MCGIISTAFAQNQRANYRTQYRWDEQTQSWELQGDLYQETTPQAVARAILRRNYIPPGCEITFLTSGEYTYFEDAPNKLATRTIRFFRKNDDGIFEVIENSTYDREGRLTNRCIDDRQVNVFQDFQVRTCTNFIYNGQPEPQQTIEETFELPLGINTSRVTRDFAYVYDDNGCPL